MRDSRKFNKSNSNIWQLHKNTVQVCLAMSYIEVFCIVCVRSKMYWYTCIACLYYRPNYAPVCLDVSEAIYQCWPSTSGEMTTGIRVKCIFFVNIDLHIFSFFVNVHEYYIEVVKKQQNQIWVFFQCPCLWCKKIMPIVCEKVTIPAEAKFTVFNQPS